MSVAEPIHGADISDYQRGVDLEQVKREGYEFCVVKASEGPYRDGTNYLTPSNGPQVDASQIAGLLTGAYHFLVETPAEAQGRGCCYVPVPSSCPHTPEEVREWPTRTVSTSR